MTGLSNARVLVIDDEEIVRSSIREILCPRMKSNLLLVEASNALFGDSDRPSSRPENLVHFEVDEAQNGEIGYAKVKKAVEAGCPYAVVFLDMRMPGWDGLTTAKRLREVDDKAELYFITAYSDYSLDEITSVAGMNVGYSLKPFSREEVRQMALKGVFEWNRLRDVEALIRVISELIVEPEPVTKFMQSILEHLVGWTAAVGSVLMEKKADGTYSSISVFGAETLEDLLELGGADADTYSRLVESSPIGIMGRFVSLNFENHLILLLLGPHSNLTGEKQYLIRLFLEHSRMLIENLRLRLVLAEAEKLTALGKAIREVAHDLRAPLGQVESAVNGIKDELDIPEYIKEVFNVIPRSLESARLFLDDIIGYTMELKLNKAPRDLREFLDDFYSLMRFAAHSKGIEFKVLAPAGIVLSFDEKRITRALCNLFTNSVEALSDIKNKSPLITIEARQDGEMVVIYVTDNGPGISKETLDTLFTPFVVSGKSRGTGLGLPIARKMVEAHGGRLTVRSSPEGTVFAVSLPLE
jgi:two-component system NtrC family sensor kinase